MKRKSITWRDDELITLRRSPGRWIIRIVGAAWVLCCCSEFIVSADTRSRKTPSEPRAPATADPQHHVGRLPTVERGEDVAPELVLVSNESEPDPTRSAAESVYFQSHEALLRPVQPFTQTNNQEDLPLSVERELEELKKRLDEMDVERQAHEDATRSVIRQTFSEQQSGINDFVTLGGTIESLVFWVEDFDGVEQSDIVLDTAEIDFEIRCNDWSHANLVIEYFDGEDFLFPTNDGDERFVDRVNVRQAYIMIGDPFKCPPYMITGRDVVPFGISTGDPVADVLSINDPLTVEVFEMQEDFIMFGLAFPTPPPPPLPIGALDQPGAFGGSAGGATGGAAGSGSAGGAADASGAAYAANPGPPHVEPILFAPMAHAIGSKVCKYCGCYPHTPPPAWTPWIEYPHFNAAVYFFNGDTIEELNDEDQIEHFGATLSYRSRGCLAGIPCSIEAAVDYNSSVFDSNFLQYEYRRFLPEIGYVPGLAAHVKSSFGPFALIVEWNGAIEDATFTDEAIDLLDIDPTTNVIAGTNHSIRPEAWQVSLAYQFNYNPWLEIIGSEGTYFVVGYSESKDLFGVNRVLGDPAGPIVGLTDDRVGFVPERRFTVGFGEWVMYGTRVAFEYAHNFDYDVDEGGTGNEAHGVFAQFTYEW